MRARDETSATASISTNEPEGTGVDVGDAAPVGRPRMRPNARAARRETPQARTVRLDGEQTWAYHAPRPGTRGVTEERDRSDTTLSFRVTDGDSR